MAVAFSRVSWWFWGGRGKDNHSNEPTSPVGVSPDIGFRDTDHRKFPAGQSAEVRPRRKWRSREERWNRVDRELDLVLVPSDGGGCLSGSESDDSDWSVGWLEPHAPGFLGDGGGRDSGADSSFGALVPCYGRGRCDRDATAAADISSHKTRGRLGDVGFLDGEGFSSEGRKYVELWLSSLQKQLSG